jgi:hypothetical protein
MDRPVSTDHPAAAPAEQHAAPAAASVAASVAPAPVIASADRPASTDQPAAAPAQQPHNMRADTSVAASVAKVALDDSDLSQIRGGLSVGSGIVVNFAFQEATYVNHNLAQSIVVPTITVSPGSSTASIAGLPIGGSAGNFSPSSVAGIGNAAAQTAVSSPGLAVQSIVNNGMTSIVSGVGGGGVTNVISNTANSQLVQQMITANIGITGLSHTIQQNVASTVLSRVQAATSQFR